ncbi:hypothetical protein, partial [Dokdonella soli]|uniref:hypothetical protein n=1 Tax=Dokdonella soli TaxID=529810 RepID=UPI00361CA452
MRQYSSSITSRRENGFNSPLMTLVCKTLIVLIMTMCQFAVTASAASAVSPSTTPPPSLVSQPCVPSGLGIDYQVGPGAGQLASLGQVPWENLAAG